jgi:hypothetical protein
MPARRPRQRRETGAAFGPSSARGRLSLWNSYAGALAPLSNSYAARDKYAGGFGRLGRITAAGFDRLFDVPSQDFRKEQPMLDAILLAFGFGFFALSIAYAYGCDRH